MGFFEQKATHTWLNDRPILTNTFYFPFTYASIYLSSIRGIFYSLTVLTLRPSTMKILNIVTKLPYSERGSAANHQSSACVFAWSCSASWLWKKNKQIYVCHNRWHNTHLQHNTLILGDTVNRCNRWLGLCFKSSRRRILKSNKMFLLTLNVKDQRVSEVHFFSLALELEG